MIGDITYFDGVPHVVYAAGPIFSEPKREGGKVKETKRVATWCHVRPATPAEVRAWRERLQLEAFSDEEVRSA